MSALLLMSTALPASVLAEGVLPSGGTVTAGSATIQSGGNGVAVNQTSRSAIVNWNSFSVGSGKSVTFNNGTGATLNRVTGNVASRIDGAVSATGNLYLVNPAGVTVGPGGRVTTGGNFVASTHDVTDKEFLDGGPMAFRGTSKAEVVNHGTIASAQGDVALIARRVENAGTIAAPKGTAALAAGYDVLMTDAAGENGCFAVRVGGSDTGVVNSGTVRAAEIEMRANGGNVYALAGNTEAVVKATGVASKGGRVFLTAGDGGSVTTSATITAKASAAKNSDGGAVTVTGGRVAVSGTIDASAKGAGTKGGRIVAVAKDKGTYAGTLRADGGKGGKGGFVETSAGTIGVDGGIRVSARAEDGVAGAWVIDPQDLVVAPSGGDITGAALSASLDTGTNVELLSASGMTAGNGDVVVNDTVSWSSNAKLTLTAVRNIAINKDITATGTSAGLALNFTGSQSLNDGARVTLAGSASTYSRNGTAFTPIRDVNALQAVSSTGHYVLANDIDASATSGWGGTGFAPLQFNGTFDGLNHTIGGLTINRPSTTNVGLFGEVHGSVSNLHLRGGTVVGGNTVGSLAGTNRAILTNVSSSATVAGGMQVGGLVGYSWNYASNYVDLISITNASATGSVTGTGSDVGGFVGWSWAAITNAFATGSVTAPGFEVGGFAGANSGTISNAYATGKVTGSGSSVGGFVGYSGGGISNAYWNKQTSGRSSGSGNNNQNGLTGLTTAELQSALPAGFGSATWGTGTGLYPYLKPQHAAAPVAVSGIAYSDVGTTLLTAGTVTAVSNGTALGSAGIGANGYYYVLGPSGSIGASGVLAYLDGGATKGAAYSDSVTATGVAGNDIHGPSLVLKTSAASLSGAKTALTSTLGGYADTDLSFLAPSATQLTGTGSSLYLSAASNFTLDQDLASGSTLALSSGGTVGLSGSRTLDAAGALTLNSAVAWSDASVLTLDAAQNLTINADITATGANAGLVLAYGGSLSLNNGARITLSGSGSNHSRNGTTFTLIRDVNELQAISSVGNYILANDIDASATGTWGAGFVPLTLGASATFDGMNHAISGLVINQPATDNVGLFGEAQGTISNVALPGGSVTGRNQVGTLVGRLVNGTIRNASASGTVTGSQNVGGLVGEVTGGAGTIVNSYATGAASGSNLVGGLVGSALSGTLGNVYATGAVTGSTEVGGLVGRNTGQSITNAYATGQVTGSSAVGGLVGTNTASSISGAVWDREASGQNQGAGSGTSTGMTGATTAEMRSLSTFTAAGWSVDDAGGTGSVWRIYDGHTAPLLRSFLTPLSYTATDASKTYDGTAYSGYSATYSDPSAMPLGTLGGNLSGTTGAGSYAIRGLYSDQSGYDIRYVSGTLTIGKAPLTVTANNAGKTYDGLAYTGGNGLSYTGLANGETGAVLSGIVAYGGTAQGAVNAGGYTITASGLTSGNYTITYAPGALTVDRAPLTVTANDAGKTYDGLAYTGGNGVSYSGFVNNQTAAVLSGTVAYGGTAQGAVNAGSHTITASGLSSANYDITYAPGALTVDRAPLTVRASDAGKTYDGLAYTGGNGVSYSGFVNGETAGVLAGTIVYGGAAQGAVNAGSHTITASGLSSANYDITYAPGTLTVDRAPLTITANSGSKTYDGRTSDGGNGVSYSGFVNGETAGVLAGTIVYTDGGREVANAGSYTITPAGLSSANYDISYLPGTLTVNKAPLTVTANSGSKTYDGVAYTGGNGVAFSGFVNGEASGALSGTISYGGGAQGAVNAGSYTITASGLSSANYDITYAPGTLTVDRAPLTITANSGSKTYDGRTSDGGNGVSYSGFVNGETAGVLAGTIVYTDGGREMVNAGSYTITPAGLSSANYDISYLPGTLTVNKASLTAAVNDHSKIYDGLTFSGGNGIVYTGFVNGETSGVLSGTIMYGGDAQGAVNAGSYAITASGLSSANYDLGYLPGTLTVNKASLTAIANDHSKTYNGLAYGGGNGIVYTGFVNGETSTVLFGAPVYGGDAQGATDAGHYTLTATGLSSANYDIRYLPGTLAVTRAPLTVTADDATSIPGRNGLPLTYRITAGDLASGDSLSGSLATEATLQSGPGRYEIGQGTLVASGNYELTFVPGILTLGARAVSSPPYIGGAAQARVVMTSGSALSFTMQPAAQSTGDGDDEEDGTRREGRR